MPEKDPLAEISEAFAELRQLEDRREAVRALARSVHPLDADPPRELNEAERARWEQARRA